MKFFLPTVAFLHRCTDIGRRFLFCQRIFVRKGAFPCSACKINKLVLQVQLSSNLIRSSIVCKIIT